MTLVSNKGETANGWLTRPRALQLAIGSCFLAPPRVGLFLEAILLVFCSDELIRHNASFDNVANWYSRHLMSPETTTGVACA
jgi:hypothetical protein